MYFVQAIVKLALRGRSAMGGDRLAWCNATVPSFSFGSASDKRYSLSFTFTPPDRVPTTQPNGAIDEIANSVFSFNPDVLLGHGTRPKQRLQLQRVCCAWRPLLRRPRRCSV